MKRLIRGFSWLMGILIICAGPGASESLADDLRTQLKKGITFFFFESPDEGIYITLRGSSAVFHYLDGGKADGSLQRRSDKGTFNFASGRIVLHGDFLKGDVTLTLKPFPSEYAKDRIKARFFLVGPDSFSGYGPVKLPSPSPR